MLRALLCADVFVGQLRSTLTCNRCGRTSDTFEPFIDLSLPIRKVQMLFYVTESISVMHCLIATNSARFRWSEERVCYQWFGIWCAKKRPCPIWSNSWETVLLNKVISGQL